MNSNTYLGIMTFMFILIAFMSVFINNEFNAGVSENSPELFDEIAQQDLADANALTFLSSLFFWVFSAPVWLNLLILTPLRVVYIIILYDKIRGIGS